jgi:hypothetical protein
LTRVEDRDRVRRDDAARRRRAGAIPGLLGRRASMSGDFWVEGMSVGVPEFDEAHKQFGQSIGRIIAALDQGAFETAAGICAAMAASAAQHGAAGATRSSRT